MMKKNNNLTKKRTFTENEQNTGSYNVGLKKQQKPEITQKQKQQVLNHLKDVNPDINLENMSQEQLLTVKATNNNMHKNQMANNLYLYNLLFYIDKYILCLFLLIYFLPFFHPLMKHNEDIFHLDYKLSNR